MRLVRDFRGLVISKQDDPARHKKTAI